MSTIFNWSIAQMQCLAQAEGQTDVVITAAWYCEGVQASGEQTLIESLTARLTALENK